MHIPYTEPSEWRRKHDEKSDGKYNDKPNIEDCHSISYFYREKPLSNQYIIIIIREFFTAFCKPILVVLLYMEMRKLDFYATFTIETENTKKK